MNKPIKKATALTLAYPPSGRLDKYGLPSSLAQRIRKLVGRKFVHADGGSEWPTNSGLIDQQSINQLSDLAKRLQA